MKLSETRLALIGLGYVGLPLAPEFAKKYPVVGFISTGKELMNCCRGMIACWRWRMRI